MLVASPIIAATLAARSETLPRNSVKHLKGKIVARKTSYLVFDEQPNTTRMSRTPYISIDLETTGIEDWCQTIEIAAVKDDWTSPLDQLPAFHCYVVHDRFIGEPYALSMHSTIFRRIAERKKPENAGYTFLRDYEVAGYFRYWICEQGFEDPEKAAFTPAGKNFSGFDRQFLKRLPGFKDIKMHHRAIDPGNLFWNPDTDRELPDSKECKKRAGIPGEVAHTALEDALDVIRMVRAVVAAGAIGGASGPNSATDRGELYKIPTSKTPAQA